jgi:chemotaxis protein CheD
MPAVTSGGRAINEPVVRGERQIVIGIGESRASADPGADLVTYALGSCIAVIAYDVDRLIGGMLHIMLPHSSLSPGRAKTQPSVFADTGIAILFQQMAALGAHRRALHVRLIGGASRTNDPGHFNVGKRNLQSTLEVLGQWGLTVAALDVGGTESRTPRLSVGDGRVVIRTAITEYEL